MIFCMWHISGPFLLPNWRDFATQLEKNCCPTGKKYPPTGKKYPPTGRIHSATHSCLDFSRLCVTVQLFSPYPPILGFDWTATRFGSPFMKKTLIFVVH